MAGGSFCAPVPEIQEKIKTQMNSMRALFNGERAVDIDGKEVYIGKAITESYGKTTEGLGQSMFEEIVWRSTYKPAMDNFTGFADAKTGEIKKADFRRIKREIEKEARNLSNKKLGPLERLFGVKRGVMSKWAITNWMNKELLNITNYERTQFHEYVSSNIAVSKNLRAEMVLRDGQSKWKPGMDAANKLEKLERDIVLALQEPDSAINYDRVNEMRKDMTTIFEKEGGGVLAELREYLEAKPVNEGTKDSPEWVVYKKERDSKGKKTGKDVRFSRNIEMAGEESRLMLDRMGGVLKRGLNQHKKVVVQVFNNSSALGENKPSASVASRVRRYHEKLDSEIKAIDKGMKDGNYFPHYIMESFIRIEDIMRKADVEASDQKKIEQLDELDSIMSGIRQNLGSVPKSSRHRGSIAYDTYLKNPLGVLRKYAMDAISFNRVNHVKNVYLQGLRGLPKDPDTAKGLRSYLEDVFTLAERGYQDRPAWVNKTVRALTGYEFLSKIGFGVATAARNTLSGLYFVQSVGNVAFARYLRNFDKNENRVVKEMIRDVEQEQGFRFEDLSNPLFTEGLLPTEGVNVRDVDIKQNDHGEMQLSYKDGNTWKSFDSALTLATGKGAIFQKVTENFLRKHMFRFSFMTKFNQLSEGGMSKSKAKDQSTKYALDIVGKYAFEYAAHQKAPVTGGTLKGYGAVGQIAAQFFHYPFSFLQMQSEILRKSKDAALAGQWDSPDLLIPLRFAGLYMFTTLMSGVFNLDFHRLMENDTIDRVKDIYNVVNGEEEVKGRGYLGPAVGDLFFLASLMEFMDMPDNELTNLIVGYNNAYSLTDEQKQTRLLSTLNVEFSKIVTRDYKALQNGTGWNVLMHEFGLYPRAWTREFRQRPASKLGLAPLFPEAGVKKSKKKAPVLGMRTLPAPKGPGVLNNTKVLKSIAKIEESPGSSKYDKFQKDNILKAIGMIKDQQKEESEIYTSENNKRMILQ